MSVRIPDYGAADTARWIGRLHLEPDAPLGSEQQQGRALTLEVARDSLQRLLRACSRLTSVCRRGSKRRNRRTEKVQERQQPIESIASVCGPFGWHAAYDSRSGWRRFTPSVRVPGKDVSAWRRVAHPHPRAVSDASLECEAQRALSATAPSGPMRPRTTPHARRVRTRRAVLNVPLESARSSASNAPIAYASAASCTSSHRTAQVCCPLPLPHSRGLFS